MMCCAGLHLHEHQVCGYSPRNNRGVAFFLLGIGRLEDSKPSLEPGVSAWNLECDGPTLPRARYRVAPEIFL